MKRILRNIGLVSAGVLVFSASKVYFDNLDKKEAAETGHQLALKFANEINKTAPRTLDSATRLDKATAGPGPTVTTHYTITSNSLEEMDKAELMKIKPASISQLCTGDLLAALNAGISFEYQYRDKLGMIASAFKVSKADCK